MFGKYSGAGVEVLCVFEPDYFVFSNNIFDFFEFVLGLLLSFNFVVEVFIDELPADEVLVDAV